MNIWFRGKRRGRDGSICPQCVIPWPLFSLFLLSLNPVIFGNHSTFCKNGTTLSSFLTLLGFTGWSDTWWLVTRTLVSVRMIRYRAFVHWFLNSRPFLVVNGHRSGLGVKTVSQTRDSKTGRLFLELRGSGDRVLLSEPLEHLTTTILSLWDRNWFHLDMFWTNFTRSRDPVTILCCVSETKCMCV